jgi:dihydrofolate reductase
LVVRWSPADRPRRPFQTANTRRTVVKKGFSCGAIITARRTFDIPRGWDGHHPGAPFFLLTHDPPTEQVGPGSGGPSLATQSRVPWESALERTRAAAEEKVIAVGAADVVQQFLKADLLDEINIDIVPILLGDGVRLFTNLEERRFFLECTRVVHSEGVTHLRYRVSG